MISKNEVIGGLHILSLKPDSYTEADLRLAEEVASQISGAIVNAQLFAERRRSEERILRQSAMLGGINRILRETLVCETEEDVAQVCLTVAEDLTGSAFGWIGWINQAGRLVTLAMSQAGLEACQIGKSNAAGGCQKSWRSGASGAG